MTSLRRLSLVLLALCLPSPAFAAEGLNGASLSLWWGLPFVGILLSIATGPVLYPHLWEHHFGKFTAFWSALIVIALLATTDIATVTGALAHTAFLEYIPFILLLLALFTVAGGIYLEGNLHDSVFTNTVMLAFGALIASVVGTTGAAMILIRPLIRANDDRRYNAHVVVFFIFLVANIGGALSPLGDPPLFIGFLKGVDFFWTTQHLWLETLTTAAIVLAVFCALDLYFHHREGRFARVSDPTPDKPLKLHGKANLLLLVLIIAAILMSAKWKPGIAFHVAGVDLQLQDLLRDLVFLLVAIASVRITAKDVRTANGFSWGPIKEVAILFAGIFICIVPVMAMLQAGSHGPFANLLTLVSKADGSGNPAAYFWLTGALSSFLDNAPTYLVFFQLAGGDPHTLMTAQSALLAAISSGAVYMGANTYIGNAPNFMVYAIARENGVKMPSFFGYMAWSSLVLLPTFLLVTWIFF
ncbi:MAG: sodium:proton antiporter [Bradyrhizobiaceae bacterium]|uniref:sodium:proton antiporter n=1 Tax=Afipia sp. 1NLS2 TaxID=666684 RepID=UPI0001D9EB57|nr:sodium:proton antiporter [Afipia sp. 1NLS2]EFI52960.1 Citrate transporter [Afipia sp. 1NLS2]RTL78290.1 MAG: sodium:proton antiporter [Bradyrhizobiaceae bacterium]